MTNILTQKAPKKTVRATLDGGLSRLKPSYRKEYIRLVNKEIERLIEKCEMLGIAPQNTQEVFSKNRSQSGTLLDFECVKKDGTDVDYKAFCDVDMSKPLYNFLDGHEDDLLKSANKKFAEMRAKRKKKTLLVAPQKITQKDKGEISSVEKKKPAITSMLDDYKQYLQRLAQAEG
jgi:hypothetical protein